MKKVFYTFILLLAAACTGMHLLAQNDSSRFDLGVVRLQKEFTQHQSIKGTDLEKMPFANLSEAINVWLYGVYSNSASLVYLVDGNIVPDVNAWNIYDIEEVVFVQSALGQLSGNTSQQQLVLVTTRKRNTSPGGNPAGRFSFRAAGQSAMVNTDYKHIDGLDATASTLNGYHNYYLSGYYTGRKIQAGVSANYLRDVSPNEKGDQFATGVAAQLKRYRFNAWATVQVGRNSSLYMSLSAAPQKQERQFSLMMGNQAIAVALDEKQFIINPYLRFQTNILPGLQNNFSASYQAANTRKNSDFQVQTFMPQETDNYSLVMLDTVRNHILALRDNLSGQWRTQDWTVEPALNLQYVYIKERSAMQNIITDVLIPSGAPTSTYVNENRVYANPELNYFTAAPSVDFSYKQVLSFGGGGFAFVPPGSMSNFIKSAIFPFAHLSLELLKPGSTARQSSLRLFASFARNYNYSFRLDRPDDFTPGNGAPFGPATFNPSINTGITLITNLPPFPPATTYDPGELFKPHNVWSAGLGFRAPGDRWVVNYNFEKRGFTALWVVTYPLPGGMSYSVPTYPLLQAYTHHIDVMAKLVAGPVLQWQSGVTGTNIRVTGGGNLKTALEGTQGDFTGHISWTGGWINRISYKRFFAGVDLLYRTNNYETVSTAVGLNIIISYRKVTSFDLQNLYAGFKLQVCKRHEAELFLSGRNLLENHDSDITDRRRYYGVGFSTSF